MLSWLQPAAEDAGHSLYFSELKGERWTAARQIAAGDGFFANWADLPMLSQAADGTLFAHWLAKLGDDTYAYGATMARSRDGGESWQEIGLLHDDASASEHGFVSYVPLPSGGVQAFWLDGRAMPAGGAMQLRSARLGEGGVTASRLLDERVCECCATDAALTTTGPVVVYRNRDPSEVRDIAIVRHTAEGWSEPTLIHPDGWQIHGCPVNGPAIAAEGSRVAVAWFTAAAPGARIAVAFSDDDGASFSQPFLVDDSKPLGRVDVALDRAGNALVSWVDTAEQGAEIRWRRVSPDGESGPAGLVSTTTAARSAGVPRMQHRDGEMLFAWVEDGKPTHLRTAWVALN
jgi:hypothetical protein